MIVIHLSKLVMISTATILAVCKMSVTYELSSMTLLTMSSGSSVEREPTLCLGGDGFGFFFNFLFFWHAEYDILLNSSFPSLPSFKLLLFFNMIHHLPSYDFSLLDVIFRVNTKLI